MELKRTQVHMLPTEDASHIHKIGNELGYTLNSNGNPFAKQQHLYITTDEEIKEGDWVYWTDPEGLTSDINQVISVDEEMIFLSHPEHSETEALPHECRKIIATTAPKLAKLIAGGGEGNAGVWKMLPQIQQSFIKEYCKAGGIDKVLVEYELQSISENTFNPFLEKEEWKQRDILRIKTDSNNCIIIHPVEESLLEECLNAIEFLSDEANTNQYSELIKKIKENL